jgi:hypothetical protein
MKKISEQLIDEIIDAAKKKKHEMDSNSAHAFQPGYNQPIGYWVDTVFTAVTSGEWFLPAGVNFGNLSDGEIKNRVRENAMPMED